jgi:hypothetical protein
MGKIRITERLTSYEVTVDLLKKIEDYLHSDIPQLLNISPEQVDSEYSVTFVDNFGTEVFKSIEDYKQAKFYNDTALIQIAINHKAPGLFKLLLTFSKDWTACNMSIECESEHAREIANSIKDGVKRKLDINKTTNHIFYPSGFITFLLILASIGLLISALIFALIESPRIAWFLVFIFVIILSCATLGHYSHPYTTFDSQQSGERKKWGFWFKAGLAGFLLFAVIFSTLYHQIVG